ncbi:uncharacterized protein LOC134265714 [Saccostrea cucullata]|uniref:uncharacterized protein LOC134265714 n=1 Tax=Saccostrea cuccullata TaxID=36930 RepID=UPI002ED6C16B
MRQKINSSMLLFGPVFRRSCLGSVICLFSLHSSQTILLNYYKELLALKDNGKPAPLKQALQNCIREVFKDLMKKKRLTEQQLKKIDIIISKDNTEPFHKGNLYSVYGSFIGLPSSFSSLDSETSQHSNAEIPDGVSNRKVLPNNLVQWDKCAVRYAIMKECILTDSLDLQVRTALQGVFCFFYSLILQWNTYRFRRVPHRIMYSIVWSALIGIVLLQQWNFYKIYRDQQADNDIITFGEDYVRGGLLYYSNVLQQNKLSGSGWYDENGNQRQSLLGNKQIPYTEKKEFFMKKMKEMKNCT